MADIDKTITTLQYRINEARNNHQKTTTIFISTLSDCLMYMKKLRQIGQPGVLLFDDPEPRIIRCGDCIHAENCEWKKFDVPGWFCADGERRDSP